MRENIAGGEWYGMEVKQNELMRKRKAGPEKVMPRTICMMRGIADGACCRLPDAYGMASIMVRK